MPDPLAKSYYRRFREANAGWSRRLAPLVLASLLVAMLGGASTALLMRYVDGVNNYRTPLAKFPPPSEATEPVVPQVVLVLIDGLREDATRVMPTWQRLRQQGASGATLVPYPTAQAAWTTLLTGAEPEINDAPLYGNGRPPSPALDSLFAAAHRANLNVALAASTEWQSLSAPQLLNEQFFPEEQDDAVADRRTADKAAGFLTYFAPNLALVQLSLPDRVAQRAGATGDAYLQAVLHSDLLLAKLAGLVDLHKSVLIVTSSFGQADRGGHNGPEENITLVPLLIAGAHVKTGDLGTVRQSDLAPTIAALVGSGIPSMSQGTILFSAFELSDVQRATKAIALARQQREFGQAYLNAIGGSLSEPALADAQVAKSSLDVKNYESAYSIASLSAQQVQYDTRATRLARIERERFTRAPLAAALVIAPLLIIWLRRSVRLLTAVIAGAAMAALQHGLYLQAQHLYSFGEINSPAQFGLDALQRSADAVLLGGLLVIVYHWRDEKPSRVRVATTLLIGSAFSIYFLSIPFAGGYFMNGLSLQWYVPDLTWAFVQVFSLASIASTSLVAVPVAAVTALVYWSGLIIAHRAARALTLIRSLSSALSQLFGP